MNAPTWQFPIVVRVIDKSTVILTAADTYQLTLFSIKIEQTATLQC